MDKKFPMIVYMADGMAVRLWYNSESSRRSAYAQMQMIMSRNAYLSDDEGFQFTCKIDNITSASVPVEENESSVDEKELVN